MRYWISILLLVISIKVGAVIIQSSPDYFNNPADSTAKYIRTGFSHKKIVVLGFETAGVGYNYKDSITNEKKYARWMRFEPNASVYFKYNIGIGVRGRIEFFRSNVEAPRPDVFEVGGFIRHYWPIKSDRRFFNCFTLFSEVAVSMANYHYIDKYATTVLHSSFDQVVIRIPTGFAFNIWKGINLEIAPRFECYWKQYRRFDVALGLSYHFNKK